MSIQSEITRISGNVSDALTAISNKGVTVPSGSNSDDLATLIGQITGGGGVSATTVVTTQDSHGGDIVTITTGIDISSDTVAADKLLYGYTAHDSTGQAITGTYEGGGSAAQTKTGTFTGTGSVSVDIANVDFAPDFIYIHGDLTGSASDRGVSTIIIVRDSAVMHTNDASTSSTAESIYYYANGISGLNESDATGTHATYSSNTLTVTTVTNTTANKFNSSITYSYKLVKWTS